jgi:hypothetical protein
MRFAKSTLGLENPYFKEESKCSLSKYEGYYVLFIHPTLKPKKGPSLPQASQGSPEIKNTCSLSKMFNLSNPC